MAYKAHFTLQAQGGGNDQTAVEKISSRHQAFLQSAINVIRHQFRDILRNE